MITSVNINGFSPNLVCALILWRSAYGLLMGKFHLFLTELSALNTSIFYFQDNNLSNYQWIFTQFDKCIYIVLWRSVFIRLFEKQDLLCYRVWRPSVNFFVSS